MTKESIEEEMDCEAYADDVAARTTFLATVFSLQGRVIRFVRSRICYITHLNPFLKRLDTVLRYRILPVPVVFRRLAF